MLERFQTFTVHIAKITRNIRRLKTKTMTELNLKSPHVSCIYYLYPDKVLSVRELLEICDEDKGAISRSITYLVNNGYIEYEKNENKKYKNKLILTDMGKGCGRLIHERINGILSRTGICIGNDLDVFYKCLDKLSSELESLDV